MQPLALHISTWVPDGPVLCTDHLCGLRSQLPRGEGGCQNVAERFRSGMFFSSNGRGVSSRVIIANFVTLEKDPFDPDLIISVLDPRPVCDQIRRDHLAVNICKLC